MDTSAIAASATQLAQARTANEIQTTVLRKALDIQAQGTLQLIDAVAPSAGSNPPNLGNNIDTHA